MKSRGHLFSFANQMWRIFSGPLILAFIPAFLSKENQGYWYVFIGLAGLIVIADLGFSSLVTSFTAHETANIKFSNKKISNLESAQLEKTGSLFRFILKWMRTSIAAAGPIIFFIGYCILYQGSTNLKWIAPWSLFFAAFSLAFLNNVFLCFIEGCGEISSSQKIRLTTSATITAAIIISLLIGLEIYALPISWMIGNLLCIAILVKKYGAFLDQLLKASKNIEDPKWMNEFPPLMKKTALSFIGGYLSFQTFTPIIFFLYGPVVAGQAGLSLAIFTAIHSISNVWLNAFLPKFCWLIVEKDFSQANKLFKVFSTAAIATYVCLSLLFINAVNHIEILTHIKSRLSDEATLYIIFPAWLLQTCASNLAFYVRAHKKEPFSRVSLIQGLYVVIAGGSLAHLLSLNSYFLIFLSSYFFTLPCFYLIYKKEKSDAFDNPHFIRAN